MGVCLRLVCSRWLFVYCVLFVWFVCCGCLGLFCWLSCVFAWRVDVVRVVCLFVLFVLLASFVLFVVTVLCDSFVVVGLMLVGLFV